MRSPEVGDIVFVTDTEGHGTPTYSDAPALVAAVDGNKVLVAALTTVPVTPDGPLSGAFWSFPQESGQGLFIEHGPATGRTVFWLYKNEV